MKESMQFHLYTHTISRLRVDRKQKEIILFLTIIGYMISLIATSYVPNEGEIKLKGYIKSTPYIVIDNQIHSGIITVDNEIFDRIEIGQIFDVKCMCIVE